MTEISQSRSQIFYSCWTQSRSKVQTQSLSISHTTHISSSTSILNNDVLSIPYKEESNIDNLPLKRDNKNEYYNSTTFTSFPQFSRPTRSIKIPKKVWRDLRYIPVSYLKAIHPDINAAREFCLLFLRNFNSTYYKLINDTGYDGWEPLQAKYLREFFSNASLTYKNIRTALEYPLKDGSIIECNYEYIKGETSYKYRLGLNYRGKGIIEHELKSQDAINLLVKNNERLYTNAIENPICRNLFHFYAKITLPTIEEIHLEARRLINLKFHTKNGKRLAYLNKHNRLDFKGDKISFVEDAIKLYNSLTDGGLMIPVPGSDKSGGRVVDSLTLMPGWIRALIKIGGEYLVECDYSCLHPNIISANYGGTQGWITHCGIASEFGLEEKAVKREHLSFFNKRADQMKKSKLYKYYTDQQPEMMRNVISEKYQTEYGHKITSRRMFKQEVEIMTDVIIQLNQEDIYVGYIYDALLCHPKHTDRVKEIMNSTILKNGVKTKVKPPKVSTPCPTISNPQVNRTTAQGKNIDGYPFMPYVSLGKIYQPIGEQAK